jgi:transposase
MRVVKRVQDGESPEVLAKALDLDRSTVYGWLARYRQGGWNGCNRCDRCTTHAAAF